MDSLPFISVKQNGVNQHAVTSVGPVQSDVCMFPLCFCNEHRFHNERVLLLGQRPPTGLQNLATVGSFWVMDGLPFGPLLCNAFNQHAVTSAGPIVDCIVSVAGCHIWSGTTKTVLVSKIKQFPRPFWKTQSFVF